MREKFWTTELVRAWVVLNNRKINKHREGLPWEHSGGSSYGNGGLVTASLVLCVPSGSGEAPLDRYRSILLDVSAFVR